MRYLSTLLLLLLGTMSMAQSLTVETSKHVFTAQGKIRKGQVLNNELISTKGRVGSIEVCDDWDFCFKSKIWKPVRIDSLYRHFRNLKPRTDSLANVVSCDLPLEPVQNTGSVEADKPRYEVISLLNHVEADSGSVTLAWQPFFIDSAQYQGAYDVMIFDMYELIVAHYRTNHHRISIDLTPFKGHEFLSYVIKTRDPCGTSFEYTIRLAKD